MNSSKSRPANSPIANWLLPVFLFAFGTRIMAGVDRLFGAGQRAESQLVSGSARRLSRWMSDVVRSAACEPADRCRSDDGISHEHFHRHGNRVFVLAIFSLFPIITNTTTGLLQIDPDLVDSFRLNRATRLQMLIKLRMPSALPYLISGIRIASGSAIVGAIVGEFFLSAGPTGLGSLIQLKVASFNMPELYAVVAVATLLGTLVFGVITTLGEHSLNRWFGMSLEGRGR